jgi:hypothetical protein
MINMRKWINLIIEIENNIENNKIKYFGNVNKAEQKWLEINGKNSYSGGELQPIIIKNEMIGGIHWDLGGVDYIEFKPEYKGKGFLKQVVQDNIEDGKVRFVSASSDLTSKLRNFGDVSYDPETDITTLNILKNRI